MIVWVFDALHCLPVWPPSLNGRQPGHQLLPEGHLLSSLPPLPCPPTHPTLCGAPRGQADSRQSQVDTVGVITDCGVFPPCLEGQWSHVASFTEALPSAARRRQTVKGDLSDNTADCRIFFSYFVSNVWQYIIPLLMWESLAQHNQKKIVEISTVPKMASWILSIRTALSHGVNNQIQLSK